MRTIRRSIATAFINERHELLVIQPQAQGRFTLPRVAHEDDSEPLDIVAGLSRTILGTTIDTHEAMWIGRFSDLDDDQPELLEVAEVYVVPVTEASVDVRASGLPPAWAAINARPPADTLSSLVEIQILPALASVLGHGAPRPEDEPQPASNH
ncbi:hypothetical protein [Kushneria phosphatilytica]|uniref:Uncharacterized protein n=1 Tax=Kushneria phosphatilytica TaxID=657387 RepID=A0A1S1NTL4_9GAMM|nr:hypothetical protein [Kushneria phosphatilytica]OHV07675.1 hypothetical protein BH688_15905 [Kushneria phosphatilytica]QEL10172.1 hypothetical protein FY550_02840 [Kushneria phosphatilytica]